jgi:hypothetical protein
MPSTDGVAASANPAVCSLRGKPNRPLDFTLKNIDHRHPAARSLGLRRETLEAFGVGYFAGRGIMHDKVVIPFHDADGLLVAYAGYSPTDGSITYPKTFDRHQELFNVLRAENAGLFQDGIVLVTDLLNVLRLYELGVNRVVALPTGKLHMPQLGRIRSLVGGGGQVDFIPWTEDYIDILAALLPLFHVRLHRYCEGSEDEFLSQVAHSFGW